MREDYNFEKITDDELKEIIIIAMANGNWHEPYVSNIIRHELFNRKCAFGSFVSSLHNTYHDVLFKYQINCNSVQIWQDASIPGRAKSVYHPIYNIREIILLIDKYAKNSIN